MHSCSVRSIWNASQPSEFRSITDNPYRHYMDAHGIQADVLAIAMEVEPDYVHQVYRGVEIPNAAFAHDFCLYAGILPDALHLNGDAPARAEVVEAAMRAMVRDTLNPQDARRIQTFVAREVQKAHALREQLVSRHVHDDGQAFTAIRLLCHARDVAYGKSALPGVAFLESTLPVEDIKVLLNGMLDDYDGKLMNAVRGERAQVSNMHTEISKLSARVYGMAAALLPRDPDGLVAAYAAWTKGNVRFALANMPSAVYAPLTSAHIKKAFAYDRHGHMIKGPAVRKAFSDAYEAYWFGLRRERDMKKTATAIQEELVAMRVWRKTPYAQAFINAEANLWHINGYLQETEFRQVPARVPVSKPQVSV